MKSLIARKYQDCLLLVVIGDKRTEIATYGAAKEFGKLVEVRSEKGWDIIAILDDKACSRFWFKLKINCE